MTDAPPPASEPVRPRGRTEPAQLPDDPAARAAADDLAATRDALAGELETLKASARAAVDVRAKVRRNPGKTAAVVGGASFLAVGGPRRVFRAVKRRIVGEPEPLPARLLPDEIDKAVRAMGDDGKKVRGALERGFAGWLDRTAKDRKAETRQRSVVNMAMKVGMPVATKVAQGYVSRIVREAAMAARPASPGSTPAAGMPPIGAAPPAGGPPPRAASSDPGSRTLAD